MRPYLSFPTLACLAVLTTSILAATPPPRSYTPAIFQGEHANTSPWSPTEKTFSTNDLPNDQLWTLKTIEQTTYAYAAHSETPPVLRSTIHGLIPHQTYQVFAYFLDPLPSDNSSSNYRLCAGLSPTGLRTFYGDYLSPLQPFPQGPPTTFPNNLRTIEASIGSIRASADGEIACFIAPSPNSQSQPTTFLGLSTRVKPMLPSPDTGTHTYHLSPQGDDAATGSATAPWRTFHGARDQLRKIRNGSTTPATVIVHAGTYPQTASLEFSEADSAITFRSAEREWASITGGVSFQTKLSPVTNPEITSRLLTREAASQLVQIDLSKIPQTTFGNHHPLGFGRPVQPQPSEVYLNGQRLTLAQYPNAGTPGIPIGAVSQPGEKGPAIFKYQSDRVDRWAHAESPWIKGYFAWGYADDRIPVQKIDPSDHSITTSIGHSYGFKPWANHSNFRRFYGVNLLEELDAPGEYWIHPSTQIAYLIPPIGANSSVEISVSQVESPLISIKNAKSIVFDGIDLSLTRGVLLEIANSESCGIQNAFLSKAGNQAVHIASGFHNYVSNCVLSNLGSGGVHLNGGNLAEFKHGRNRVDFCEISEVNHHELTYRGAVNTDGFGNIVTHCLIHTMPQMAILATGSHQEISYNEITHAFYDAGNDSGTIYQGRSPIGYNHIHHNVFLDCANGSPFAHDSWAVYLDDGYCGASVTHNTFIRSGLGHSIFIAGGSRNTVTHNHFIDSASTVRMDNRLQTWAAWVLKPDKTFDQLLKSVNYQSPPWSTQHPELVDFWKNSPAMPNNTLSNNTCLRTAPHKANPAWWHGTPDETVTQMQAIPAPLYFLAD